MMQYKSKVFYHREGRKVPRKVVPWYYVHKLHNVYKVHRDWKLVGGATFRAVSVNW